MPDLTASLTVDISALQPNWLAAKAALQDTGRLVSDAQQAVGRVSFQAVVAASPGVVTFTADAAPLRTAILALRASLATATGELDTLIALLNAGLPVTVTRVA